MRILKVEGNAGVVEAGGVKRRIYLDLVEEAREGDYVIVHAGYAIHKIDESEAQENLELLQQYLSSTDDS
jgi:hydrogenase expression/formation protein HypC